MSQPTDPGQLRDRLAEALREAPVRATVMRMDVLMELYGPVSALTDAVLGLVQADRADMAQATGNAVAVSIRLRDQLREAEDINQGLRNAARDAREAEKQAREERDAETRRADAEGLSGAGIFSTYYGRWQGTIAEARRHNARADKAEQHVEELQDKLLSFGVNGGCCCSYDNPGDICMVHSPTVRRLEAELAEARAQLAAAGLLPVPQPPDAQVLECGATLFRTFDGPANTHPSHTWAPQPGVTPVWCPGFLPDIDQH